MAIWAAGTRRRHLAWHPRNPVREIFVVLFVLSLVTGLVAKLVVNTGPDAARTASDQNAAAINRAIERWYFEKGRWPAADLSDIARDRAYFRDGIPCCPITGAPYRMDPRTHRVVRHTAEVAERVRME